MAKISVAFNRLNALKYQQCTLTDMINQAESDLQCLQDSHQKQSMMRNMINDSLEVWQPMSEILQPMNNMQRAKECVKYQQMLIDFMKIKKNAVTYLIENQEDPSVSY